MKDPPAAEDFKIAVICALPLEANAVQAVFGSFWEDDKIIYGKAPYDTNSYTTGMIGDYNVVLAHMPDYGTTPAATVAAHFRHTFPGIKIGFVVGICGGAPKDEDGEDVWLGDVVISTEIVQYDLGRQLSNKFETKYPLGSKLDVELQGFLNQMKASLDRTRLKAKIAEYLEAPSIVPGDSKPKYPGADKDKLFSPTHLHKHHESLNGLICTECKESDDVICETAAKLPCAVLKCNEQVIRNRLNQAKDTTAANQGISVIQAETEEASEAPKPSIHYGVVASGNSVIRSSKYRDDIVQKTKAIAFEMEGAGVWQTMPSFIIKGVCDYADSHKNDQWQGYAAATAAACLKAFLERWRPTVDQLRHVSSLGEW